MSKNEFYIGWQEEMPPSNKIFIRNILIGIFVLIPVLVFAVVHLQKPMNHHHFEFGTITELKGIYYEEPAPLLIVESGIPEGFSKEVLLVGFGKLGASGIISDIEEKEGTLNGKEVSLNGTLIYGDGVTLMELTNLEDSFISAKETEKQYLGPETKPMDVTLKGEILDPKCYFGVMKPGEGKIHKSCAIRCISGGIPPVMRVLQSDGINYDYYLVKEENGEEINKEVLPFVAETISVSGMSSIQHGWNVLEIDMETIERKMK
ncbi:MAG: hypothetical protein BalsKO_08190 [Balneolaceae bacterium]